jgi:hypothetical protein
MFELAPGQHWTPFLEEVNDLMLEEKVSRHENDGVKTSEICLRIVSEASAFPRIIWLTPLLTIIL